MAFPLNTKVEFQLDGVWTTVTSDVHQRDDLVIKRGRSDESGQVEPSTCPLTLNNTTGDYSPRNPTGAHFGILGRATPVRVSVPSTVHLLLPGGGGDRVDTPDSAGLSVTGDIDIRLDLTLTREPLYDDETFELASKYATAADQRSWRLTMLSSEGAYRRLQFIWSSAGTAATLVSETSTAPVPYTPSGRVAVRVTLDVDNGAAGKTVTFYTSDTIDGTWTQLGDPVTTAGTTSIFDSTASLEIGDSAVGFAQGELPAKVWKFELRNGIGGSAVANPNFTAQTVGATSFADAAGNTWTLRGNAELTDRDLRFVGEIASLEQRADPSGTDRWAETEAAGVLRRLGQGASALKSTLHRALTSTLDATVVAYWPCEDDSDATELASALPGHPAMRFTGALDLASFSDFKASAALPTASGLQWTGAVPAYASTGAIQVRFLMAVPAAGVASTATVCRIRATGTAPRWDLTVSTAGSLRLQAFDFEDVQIADSGFIAFVVNGELLRVSVELGENGADVDWRIATLEVGASTGLQTAGTLTSRTVGRAVRIGMNVGGTMTDTALGHVSVQDTVSSIFDAYKELNAWAGEAAGRRIERLCSEEGVTFTRVGNPEEASTTLGYQLPKTLLELLREAADADLGILYEPRHFYGLAYRHREGLYAQDALLQLDHSGGDLSGFEPVDDDQRTRNDVTVKRDGGASARAELTTGALSVTAPPDGAGRYDEEITASLETDRQTAEQATWRLHLGTVDESRYPVLGANLARSNFTTDAALTADAQSLDVGNKVTVTNLPSTLPPDDSSQIVQGLTETLRRFEWLIEVNCSPASPWDVAVWDDTTGPGEARYESDGSTLGDALTTTQSLVIVTTPTGPVWSDADQPFDIYVGGERMTVLLVAGSASTQSFTVTRSVNGVVKTHAAGAEVRLFKQAIYAL